MKSLMMKTRDLRGWDKNPRAITKEGYERLKRQIKKKGIFKPLLVDQDGTVIGGNMRLKALTEMGVEEVWVSQVECKDDDERLEYALSDNDRAGYYLDDELIELLQDSGIDLGDYAVDLGKSTTLMDLLGEGDDFYTRKIVAPIYEVRGETPEVEELVDTQKVEELTREIDQADIPEELKSFLKLSAHRHAIFDYAKIAEYYAQTTPDIKNLFEKSALVIIDFADAIKNGYVKLTQEIMDIQRDDYEK